MHATDSWLLIRFNSLSYELMANSLSYELMAYSLDRLYIK